MDSKEYAGMFDIVLEKRNEDTVICDKNFGGLIKISPRMQLDSEKVSAYFIVGLGGGYVEGEKYKFKITLRDGARAVLTTQASTKVYKCEHGLTTKQNTEIVLGKGSVLEYVTDSVILYKNADYMQENDIYLDEDSTLIYTDGITSGWSQDGEKFQYSRAHLINKVYMDGKIVLVDNLISNPKDDDVTEIGYFEGYQNFGTLLVIDKHISESTVIRLRNELKNLNLNIRYGISELEVSGFVLRVLGNLTQDINEAIALCHNFIRNELLGSHSLSIRKY